MVVTVFYSFLNDSQEKKAINNEKDLCCISPMKFFEDLYDGRSSITNGAPSDSASAMLTRGISLPCQKVCAVRRTSSGKFFINRHIVDSARIKF